MKRSNEDILFESMLRNLPPCPSASFTDEVMRRVAKTPRPAAITATAADTPMDDTVPWWTRALLEPVTILAFLAAALLAGWPAHFLRWSTEAALPFAAEWVARTTSMMNPSSAIGDWIAILLVSIAGSLLLSYFAYRGALSAGSLAHSFERALRRQ
jgi:hypothetical protein